VPLPQAFVPGVRRFAGATVANGARAVNQELGRIGVLPFARLWASNKPFGAPLAGLSLQWFMCVIVILAPPPGDAYNFVLNRTCAPSPLAGTLF
jgi:hypothetical protein